MQTLAMKGYSSAEVEAALLGASRSWSFRYELLSSANEHLGWLDGVAEGEVSYNALAEVKGTASFLLSEEDGVNFLSDRIRPWVRLTMPGDPGYVEWAQGVYLLASPTREALPTGRVLREVEGYDQGLVLRDDLIASRHFIAAGTVVTTAVQDVVEDRVPLDVAPSSLTLPSDREWRPGTSRWEIVSELLTVANYEPLWFDAMGTGRVEPYQSPADQAPAWTYAMDEDSVTLPKASQERDLYEVANRWVLVASEPDTEPLSSVRVNDSASSPTSTVSRGRTITDFRTVEGGAPDQATLDARAKRLAFEASQVYEAVEFETGLMPFHEHAEVYAVNFPSLNLSAKFSEHRWGFRLQAGARMEHRARRVVAV